LLITGYRTKPLSKLPKPSSRRFPETEANKTVATSGAGVEDVVMDTEAEVETEAMDIEDEAAALPEEDHVTQMNHKQQTFPIRFSFATAL
jgi:hypothetical protein